MFSPEGKKILVFDCVAGNLDLWKSKKYIELKVA